MFSALFSMTHAESGTFLLLLGPSGSGKSTLIRHLQDIDARFVYISPYTTRELRLGEIDKVHVDLENIQEMERNGKLLTVNSIYGIYYATPKDAIDNALKEGNIPVLDWPIDEMDIMMNHYGSNLLTIYVEPESLDALEIHLTVDGRDKEGKRFAAGKSELQKYYRGDYDHLIHYKVLNIDGQSAVIANSIYQTIRTN
jgi:guanylate kinase